MVIRVPHANPLKLLRFLAQAALLLLVVTLPWRQRLITIPNPTPPIYADFTDLLLFSSDIFLFAVTVLGMVILYLRGGLPRISPHLLWLSLLGVVGMSGLSVLTAIDRPLAAAHTIRTILLFGLIYYLANEFTNWRLLYWAVGLQVFLQAALSFGQVIRQESLGLESLGERVLSLAGGSAYIWAEGGLISLRPYGLSDHPNILGANLSLSLILLLAGVLALKRPWLLILISGIGGSALFLSFSRSAWLAFVLGGLVVFLLGKWHRSQRQDGRWLVWGGSMTLFILPVLLVFQPYLSVGSTSELIQARFDERQTTRSEDSALNHAANLLFISNAVTGVGRGAMPEALWQLEPEFPFDFQPVRINILNAAVEIGLFGALFYLLALAAPWIIISLRREELVMTPIFSAASGLLAATIVFGLFDAYPWFNPGGYIWQWLGWGIWLAAYRESRQLAISNLGEMNA